MLLLYTDESGQFGEAQHGVWGGVAIRDADVADFRNRFEGVVGAHLDEHNRGLEVHAAYMNAGKEAWRKIPREVRHSLMRALTEFLGAYEPPSGGGYGLFAVARAPRAVPHADPTQRSFQELVYHFDSLVRRTGEEGRERGLVVADESKHEAVLQAVMSEWRTVGDARRFGRLSPLDRIVEVPLFVDSRATRLLQAADLVAHATWQFYENRNPWLLEGLLTGFDTDGGVIHGLVHLRLRYRECTCPACVSRVVRLRLRRTRGQKSEQLELVSEEAAAVRLRPGRN